MQQHGQLQYAREMYKKMGDIKSVVTLYVEAQEWNEAFTLAEKYPEYREQVSMFAFMTSERNKVF